MDLENNVLKLHYIFPLNEKWNLIIYTWAVPNTYRTNTVNPKKNPNQKIPRGKFLDEASLIKQNNTGKYSKLHNALGNWNKNIRFGSFNRDKMNVWKGRPRHLWKSRTHFSLKWVVWMPPLCPDNGFIGLPLPPIVIIPLKKSSETGKMPKCVSPEGGKFALNIGAACNEVPSLGSS